MNIRQLDCSTVSRSFFSLFFFSLMNNNKNYSGTYEPGTRRHNHVHLFDKLAPHFLGQHFSRKII